MKSVCMSVALANITCMCRCGICVWQCTTGCVCVVAVRLLKCFLYVNNDGLGQRCTGQGHRLMKVIACRCVDRCGWTL